MRLRQIPLLLVAGLFSSAVVALTAEPVIRDNDVSMETYLSLLTQVAPVARDAAKAYLSAYQIRCGRPLKVVELRRAFAEGNGDPTLLAMVRAMYERDAAAIQRLSGAVRCREG